MRAKQFYLSAEDSSCLGETLGWISGKQMERISERKRRIPEGFATEFGKGRQFRVRLRVLDGDVLLTNKKMLA